MRLAHRLGRKRFATASLWAAALIAALLFSVRPAPAQASRDSAAAKSASGAAAPSGKELFAQHCASCHFSQTTAQKIGPGLKGLYKRAFADGKKVNDEGLTKWIESGGKNMPGFKEAVKPDELRALIVYIKTL